LRRIRTDVSLLVLLPLLLHHTTRPGGCPLTQTLLEGGLRVLLLERGAAVPTDAMQQLQTTAEAQRGDCTEYLRSSNGISIAAGNCLGGGSAINYGVYIEETEEWLIETMGEGFATVEQIRAEQEWVRERIGAVVSSEPEGSGTAVLMQEVIRTMTDPGNIELGSVGADGSVQLEENKAWRGWTIFAEGRRRSAAEILDLDHPNLDFRPNTKVKRVLWDGDLGVPSSKEVRDAATDLPRARCVRLQNNKIECVNLDGRIYLASGAIHSPELLMKSGVGPRGRKYKNPEVGQNLKDKALMAIAGSLQPSFDNEGEASAGNICVSKTVELDSGALKTVLVEENSCE